MQVQTLSKTSTNSSTCAYEAILSLLFFGLALGQWIDVYDDDGLVRVALTGYIFPKRFLPSVFGFCINSHRRNYRIALTRADPKLGASMYPPKSD